MKQHEQCHLTFNIPFSRRSVAHDARADDDAGRRDAAGPEAGVQGGVGGARDHGAQLGVEERRDGHDGDRGADQGGPLPSEPVVNYAMRFKMTALIPVFGISGALTFSY